MEELTEYQKFALDKLLDINDLTPVFYRTARLFVNEFCARMKSKYPKKCLVLIL
ncbi:MAG: hypothetical protein LBN19_03195 [Endomicrobium sp.]|jgi:hypothetical protein|nr:hypothetical protein [Endomicrobium sp.]